MDVEERFDNVKLLPLVGHTIELTEEMCIARVRPVHPLKLETELKLRCFLRVDRLLQCQKKLIEERHVGAVGKQMPEVQPIGRTGAVESVPGFDMPGKLHVLPPSLAARHVIRPLAQR